MSGIIIPFPRKPPPGGGPKDRSGLFPGAVVLMIGLPYGLAAGDRTLPLNALVSAIHPDDTQVVGGDGRPTDWPGTRPIIDVVAIDPTDGLPMTITKAVWVRDAIEQGVARGLPREYVEAAVVGYRIVGELRGVR